MKTSSIKKYLRPNTIMSRKSTFSNAFASAVAPYDDYTLEAANAAITGLGQDADADLECVYCGKEAATWDHVFNRVLNGEFSGHGHRIRNLVPCCRSCNEKKGKKHWKDFLEQLEPEDQEQRIHSIERFLDSSDALPTTLEDMKSSAPAEVGRFLAIRAEIFQLMEDADSLAKAIRQKMPSGTS